MTTYSIDGSPMPAGTQAITIRAIERIQRHDTPHYSARISWGAVSFTAQIGIDRAGRCRVLIPCLNPLDYYTFQPIDANGAQMMTTPAVDIKPADQATLNAAARAWYWEQEKAITAARLTAIQRSLDMIEGAQ